ncbi:hypothetical protein [Fulvivirga lutea]|uniref:Sulfotransferase family protein n=1 Tax=Fulvivirga lutea TaxID=2810512 RepID=A0A974WJL4_9BACT|nr:hypothetical protein [Fulvivirga lutea]QSE98407.1 hypothetical protein JR347_04840 [Fulvivirga lutea]
MNVFILCTGRCGSTTFIRACKFIENFTSGHETLSREIGNRRFAYSENHIEADNRLSWFLGELEERFGDKAFYVHLTRDKDKTVNSFNKRWDGTVSIIRAFSAGILMKKNEMLTDDEKLHICEYYYDTVNRNISHFLKNKTNKMAICLENIENDFELFWKSINAKGDMDVAVKKFKTKYNQS